MLKVAKRDPTNGKLNTAYGKLEGGVNKLIQIPK